MKHYDKVIIERRGKIPVEYALIQYIRQGTYFAVKTKGGERPRIVYLINLTAEDVTKFPKKK